jgi:DNA-binding LytR/AlgR family response regulator
MIDVVICDDDSGCRKAVTNIVKKFMRENKIEYNFCEYTDYNKEFMKIVATKNKKIYILDIETPSRSGIDIARMIRKKDAESVIIFVTGHEEFGRLVLKRNIMCLSFINKFEDLRGELTESLKEAIYYLETNKVLRITGSGVTYNIRLNNILYFTKDSLDRKVIIMSENTEYRVNMTLSEAKEMLGDRFVQTHRSCYVNENRIEKIDHKNKTITFDNGITIDFLSDTYSKELK